MSLPRVIPLSEPGVGQRLRLVGIDGGERLRRRLLALGLRVGGEVEVVHRRNGGVVLARDGNRVALGNGVAQKVLAEVIE
jgi:Fe2+ transport system protein FeoA